MSLARSRNGIESAMARAACRLPSQAITTLSSLIPLVWIYGTTITGRPDSNSAPSMIRSVGEARPEREEIPLELLESLDDGVVAGRGACQAEGGVELVDVAVRVDAAVGLPHAGAVEQGRIAVVAGARVDLHDAQL